MNIADIFRETFSALLSNKARSGLTILGIVIGIGSVIAMISVGQGSTASIQSSIQSLGSNLLMVSPSFQRGVGMQVSAGRGSARTLKQEDVDAIQKEIMLIKAIAPELSSRYQIIAKGTNTNTSVLGTTPNYPEVRNVQIESGSFVSEQNVRSLSKVAVLGPTTRDDLFGEGVNPIGQTIHINKVDFKVIGVTKEKGGSGMSNQDDMIFVPLSTAQRFLAGSSYLSTIYIEIVDQESMTTAQEQITSLLLSRHNISNPELADFSVINQADIVASVSSISSTLTILLAAIAGISLIVGGIGIMNMMLTTVTERTREIGLRKAIGAKKKDISLQFLIESIMLTFIGGIVGIFLGWILSYAVAYFGSMTTEVTSWSIFLAVGVSACIGIIFGFYPARRAAGLNPIEALRYE
ncbi:multidrug ABC transporter substrate-binding protein [bacterium (Candidatus Gribaldobacteria) CG_4_10_14_0_2_um_filter_41_16]|uniref:Multidrug ABC transporter substrate-binding protein n=3 Tax=Candidatus Gribaldobacteria TaxID=2798536 RepID=A0A2M7VJA8_9BACT|nr:MAG: multidrug ABC transporter substrate-binding protein [bacterium (Candidatus Gribaldobacteria) CG10_big_fil_rev_8_21_14_0_10_41_12]PIV46735.1 MAG: multidrug ABC transporter substrate-binding protein [bacterium (Candidatus Gribaldobacteria) CG02_land_8_20_14_3_00_41_15]PJA01928.1 MAG: multidrug ABC transporter substrate-binding protein [bacterium (Candidatus Gribaldobacteria) CG_4_10_14_0_2_um_filter_41_16]